MFDIPTLAILTPIAMLWTLLLAAYSQLRAKGPRTLRSAPVVTRSGQRGMFALRLCKVSKATQAQLRIYGLCLTLSTFLQSIFTVLNFWHAPMQSTYGKFLPTILVMLSYQLLSIAIVSPLFISLQLELNRRLSAISSAPRSQKKYVLQILLFIVIACVILPILEGARVALGLSGTPEWVARDLFRLSIAVSTVPTAALGFFIAFIRPKELRKLKDSEFRSYKSLLEEDNFQLLHLEKQTDEEIIKIISVANHMGELDKADVLSNELLNRHSSHTVFRLCE